MSCSTGTDKVRDGVAERPGPWARDPHRRSTVARTPEALQEGGGAPNGVPPIRSDGYQAWATPLSSKMNDKPQIGVSSPFAGSGTI